jgi:hydroxyacylglutathione hydrolase
VNTYLLQTDGGWHLIDSGTIGQRRSVERQLQAAGCKAGGLRLIVLTHGDFDHTGNAAYLRRTYGGQIAMHAGDAGMAEHGDMFWNRKSGNAVMGWLMNHFFGLRAADRFSPDILLHDGQDLSEFGLPARIVSFPGHSLGSIGILTCEGDLFCGDLLESTRRPQMGSIIDDRPIMQASVGKIKGLGVRTVYPGHGRPFAWQEFLEANPPR